MACNDAKHMDNIRFAENEFYNWLKTADYNGAIGLTAKFYVKDDNDISEFKELMGKNVAVSRGETGCRLYKLNADYQSASVFWLVEEWDTVTDLMNHCTTDEYAENSKLLIKLLDNPPCQIGLYKVVE